MSVFQVRTLSPWPTDIKVGEARFSDQIPSEKADALLCKWGPSEELFAFPRRKAWYSVEPPVQFNGIDGGTWPSFRDRLAPHEFLWYNHPDERFRIPETTHFEPLEVNHNRNRQKKAVAVVSNYGGNPLIRRRDPDVEYRNQFVLLPQVDLYGRAGWQRYRKTRLSLPGPPPNYKGSPQGDWETSEKRDLLATYHAVVCLENAYEPMSFSEKLVEAVRAGAVPIFRAHPTVRRHFLEGARWVDPQDFDDNPSETIEAALASDREEFAAVNAAWFEENKALASTHQDRVFEKILSALREDC